jgi:3D (Asp-Asp-Asp) domain-containing protein
MNDNGVICIAVHEHQRLVCDHRHYRRFARFTSVAALFFGLLALAFTISNDSQSVLIQSCKSDVQDLRHAHERASVALAALARSHEEVLNAKEQINDVGDKSWGRKFVVTKYTPSAGGINAYGDGTRTSTYWKADPTQHIVAVDPNLVPYGSWVWIEGLGWFQAQDCGEAIKGFRLDVMNADLKEALAFGKQGRFAIVVPKGPPPVSFQAVMDETPPSALRRSPGNRANEALRRSDSPMISTDTLLATRSQSLLPQPATPNREAKPRDETTHAALMQHFQEEHAKNVGSGSASVPEQHAALSHAFSWIKNLALR